MSSESSFENKATLAFLSNPLYQMSIEKQNQDVPNKEEQKFYRKRILSLHKDMLRGIMPNKDIKQIHDNYVFTLINYFKMIDKKDILQEEYDNLEIKSKEKNENFDIKKADTLLMEEQIPTLDKFVKCIKYKDEPIPPKQKNINLKTDKLRTKGIKKKKSKKENIP